MKKVFININECSVGDVIAQDIHNKYGLLVVTLPMN